MKVLVAQLGARMHYAVPRLLHQAGCLEHFYTDLCALKGWPSLLRAIPKRWRPARLERLLTREPTGVAQNKITAFTGFGWEYACRLKQARDTNERNQAYLWAGEKFCQRVIRAGFGGADMIYGFNSASLELLREGRRRGLRGVVEQTITPRRIEWRLLEEEEAAFPDWEPPLDTRGFEEYCAREEAEWQAADLVLCASEYVRGGILNSGGDPGQCAVVPYGFDSANLRGIVRQLRADRAGPLRVLTVGSVGLRKGSPYVLEAARQMKNRVQFRMVGPLQVSDAVERDLRQHVEITGIVPRSEIHHHYAWADVFLLPSLCEGSATSTYEALAYGLPTLCTPETGSVVCDGEDGFIFPARQTAAIVERLERLAGDVKLLAWMSANAEHHSRDYTLARYGERLMVALHAQSPA